MKKVFVILSIVILLVSALTACGSAAAPTTAPEEASEETASQESNASSEAESETEDASASADAGEVDLGIEPLTPDGKYILPIQATGPNGEDVVGVEEVLELLAADDIKKIKEGDFTAAIVMADFGNDWAQGQIKGISETLEKFNIEIVASTDAKWKVEQQIADLESVIQLEPDVIFSHPTDGVAVGPTYKKAADAGIEVVFIDSPGANLAYPDDYAGIVQADNYVIARASAEILAELIGEEGEVALINYKNSVPHMDMREMAAKETFASYPNITVVADQKVGSNEEGAEVAESIMIANPDVKAIWAGWDGPAMTAAAALNSIGKDVYIAAPDLGRDAAFSIASDGLFVGSGAQHPWDQGVAAAVIGVTSLAGKDTPQYVVVPGEKVTKENLAEAWDRIYHAPMPTEIEDALNASQDLSAAANTGGVDLGIEPLTPDGKYILPIQATGPNGEDVVGVEEVLELLNADDVKALQDGNLTAAIVMADSGNDWAQGQIKGISETLEKFGVEIVASTDAKWKVEQQIADLESVIQLEPDVIFSHPTDGVAVGPTYKKAADAGIEVVFIDSPGANLAYPDDYAGIVQADNYVIARASAEILAELIGEEGEVALINYKNSVPHMDMREMAAKETFASYPNITVVADQKVGSNEEGAEVAESIMIANPDVKAIWAGWDGPAMTAAAALNSIGKDVYIAAPDLGRDAAFSIASDGLFVGSGAQHPWDQGVAAAVIGMTALAGKDTPQYVVVPGEKVTKENLAEAWDRIYHAPMPTEIEDALNN